MKKILYFLIAVIGSYFVYRSINVYWMLGFLGLWLAFGFTLLKLHFASAFQLWGVVLGSISIMLGGGVVIARQWSEFAAGVWIFICIILLMVFQKKLIRLVTIFRIADDFEKIVKQSEREEKAGHAGK